MRFYGLLDHDLQEVIEFWVSNDAAQHELAEVLSDEPGWIDKLEIVLVDIGGPEPTVASTG
jgi:hypothetical protein